MSSNILKPEKNLARVVSPSLSNIMYQIIFEVFNEKALRNQR